MKFELHLLSVQILYSCMHMVSKEKHSREHDITQAFKVYEQEVHPTGESLPEAHKLWRVKVVTTFLRAGVPLANIDLFRDLLEEHAYSLSDRCGMCDMIPFIQSEEQQQIKTELEGEKVSVIFNGTTRLGEALSSSTPVH